MMREDAIRLVALAQRLGCTPCELLVAAARGVDTPDVAVPEHLAHVRALVEAGDPRVQACANLLLTSPGSYATDELDNLLASIWRTGGP
ncbi:MAG TPA: hypothetical protein PKO41_01615 [Dokdonella sp.]|uniref:hypothetical protein n=1 Tax=Dokdonella sp. TaxID=2291710 RepID=UPI0025B822AB|nr:hypothetical protein [Dokdonella sp.]MBX3691160.1 hypothetical protein [Dokdonella sp.]MCW5566839.1 hypothetical protein [Dokdonella sp.]HNR91098.1 hypothetical protein [Dokdonella sp.]